ncbi:MAG: alpha/beta fold hydrolase [Thermoplasmatota archaeon]
MTSDPSVPVPLAHEAWGDHGAPLLLLHGFPLSRAIWSPVLPALSKHTRVVAIDLAGSGASPAPPAPATVEGYARDVLALADKLGHGTFDLAAHSMGGYVALALLEAAPDRVRKLVLLGTRSGADSPETRAMRSVQANDVDRKGVRAFANRVVPRLLAHDAPDLLKEEVRRIVEGSSASGIARALEAMSARPDRTQLLAGLRQPTLIIAGANDQTVPTSETEKLANAIVGARFSRFERSGHLPMMEEPARFADEVSGFVGV